MIRFMYEVRLCSGAPTDVIIEGDWYVPVTDSKLGLHRVEYSPNFESETCGFLKDCVPNSVCLWPANPFEEYNLYRKIFTDVDRTPGRKYCVITHGIGDYLPLDTKEDLEREKNTPEVSVGPLSHPIPTVYKRTKKPKQAKQLSKRAKTSSSSSSSKSSSSSRSSTSSSSSSSTPQ